MTNIQSLRYDKKRCFLRVDIEAKGIMHKRQEQTEMRGEEKLIWILVVFDAIYQTPISSANLKQKG